MDETFVKSRHTRSRTAPRRRRKNPYSKDASKGYDRAMRKIALAIIVIVIMAIAANVDTPATNSISSKAREILGKDTNVKALFEKADTFIKKWMAKDSEKKENTTEESVVTNIAEVNTDGSESIDYGGGVEEETEEAPQESIQESMEESTDENVVGYSDAEVEGNVDLEVPKTEEEKDTPKATKKEEEITKKTTPSKTTSNSKIAMAIPVFAKISSGYGKRTPPLSGASEFHKGVDIAANSGESVKAALAGEIIEAKKDSSFGNYIKIQHEKGLQTLYAHCSSLLVKKGQKVKKGQFIAKVGSTGTSNGPHLHFEVIKDGKTVNPLNYIKLPIK